MLTPLALKREILKNLRSQWIKHEVCKQTGQVKVGSIVLNFTCELGYVTASIPNQFGPHIAIHLNYIAFDGWFFRLSELYKALPGKYCLLPIVQYPKPKIGRKNAKKQEKKEVVSHAA